MIIIIIIIIIYIYVCLCIYIYMLLNNILRVRMGKLHGSSRAGYAAQCRRMNLSGWDEKMDENGTIL
jgi:flagellar basal body-associated protein FliL